MAVSQQATRDNKKAGSTVFDVDASGQSSARKVNVPEVAAGLLLVVGAALGALWWQTSSYPTTSILVVGQPIERGQVLSNNALGVVEMKTSDGIASIGADQADWVSGQVAVSDLEPGTVLTPLMISEVADIGPNEAVVGLFLGASRVPSLHLGAGTIVQVVSNESAGGTPEVLVERAEVVDVALGSGFGDMLVSVRVPSSQAAGVAVAGSKGGVVLVEIADR